jgi:hypothetical protein
VPGKRKGWEIGKKKSNMSTNFTQKGIEMMKQAVAADQAENYDEALRLYMTGIDYFMTGLKCEPKIFHDLASQSLCNQLHNVLDNQALLDKKIEISFNQCCCTYFCCHPTNISCVRKKPKQTKRTPRAKRW